VGARRAEARGKGSGPSAPARQLLKFSTPRAPTQLAAFINLRVLNPEHEQWRRGVEAWRHLPRAMGVDVPFTFHVPTGEKAQPEGWSASLAHFPLGQWVADARHF
jgi:hypothetical protein